MNVFAIKGSSLLFVLLALVGSAATASETSSTDTDIIATQGGVQLTLEDVDGYALGYKPGERAALFHSDKRVWQIMTNLLVTKQLATEAVDLGLADKVSVEEQVQFARMKILADARMQALKKKLELEIPDLEPLARERYMTNPEQWVLPREVDVKHILISNKQRDDADAKALVAKLLGELQEHPENFDDYIAKYSDASQKRNTHGLITNANSGKTVEAFRDAADKMQTVGELSDIVKTSYGYHILKAVKITPERKQSFADVKDDMVSKLEKEWVAKKLASHTDLLRSKGIQPNMDALAGLTTRYADDNDNPQTREQATSN